MNLERLQKVKIETQKPVLRKDFITDEYEVYEARAFGADAILLMANLLDKAQLARLHEVACELKMAVLFETHTADEIAKAPGEQGSMASIAGVLSHAGKLLPSPDYWAGGLDPGAILQ